jgi:hypothetical protein
VLQHIAAIAIGSNLTWWTSLIFPVIFLVDRNPSCSGLKGWCLLAFCLAVFQVMVEAQLSDGSVISCMLQNAETVKVAGRPGSVASNSAPEAQQGQSHTFPGHDQDMNLHSAQSISVAVLQPGNQLLIHLPTEAARHTGIAVKEFVKEV